MSHISITAVIGMALSLILAGFVARSRKQQNWFVYSVAGATMLSLVALDYLGIVSALY